MVPGLSNSHIEDRQNLQNDLLNAVKQCQIRFGGRKELATEFDPHVAVLCGRLEAVLSHGLRPKVLMKKNTTLRQVTDLVLGVNGAGPSHLVFWHYVREHLTKHERERYELLKQVWTDTGRGRAWLRSALNERSLERYLTCLVDVAADRIAEFYDDWAFLRDQERSAMLPNMAAGLASILFAVSIDKTELNQGGGGRSTSHKPEDLSEPVVQTPESTPGAKQQRLTARGRKRIPANIISFEEEEVIAAIDDCSTGSPTSTQSSNAANDMENELGAVTVGVDCLEVGCASDLELATSDLEQDQEPDLALHSDLSTCLRPVSNSTVGELTPVPLSEETHSSEDSLSVPSVSEEGEPTAGNDDCSSTELPGGDGSGRESAEQELTRLRRSWELMKEANVTLRTQLAQTARQGQERGEQADMRINALNRENELLKHQLRKYVGAVQMLKQEGVSGDEEHLYEQKLIQVAEMHGELMELNERLVRSTLSKENIICRLRLELEALRGPLPMISLPHDDTPLTPALLSLWVPSAFLTGQSQQRHHVYQIHIRVCDEEWNVYRRYAQFYVLNRELRKQHPLVSTFQFPPKKTLGNKDAGFVEERRQRLEQYLRRVVNHFVLSQPALATDPSKRLLLELIPFFGEQIATTEQRSRHQPALLLMGGRGAGNASSPQYTGL